MGDFIDAIYKQIGESDYNQDVSGWLSTGILQLDEAMSGRLVNGGFPIGRISEVFGPESSGKTLLATMALKKTQELGGLAVFLDHEHAFSLSRGRTLGLSDDPKQWIYKQPNTAEESFGIIEVIGNQVKKGGFEKHVTIVVDSIASMVTKSELETDYGDENMKTRLSLAVCMSTSLKKLAPIVSKTNITMIFLNQIRSNPGVMFGDKESTPGGKAMKFYASTRVKLARLGKEKDGDEIVGERVRAQVIKNKVFEPFRQAEYITSFKTGVNLPLSHLDFMQSKGMLGETKGWLEFAGKKFRMKELVALCHEKPEIYEQVLNAIRTFDLPVEDAA